MSLELRPLTLDYAQIIHDSVSGNVAEYFYDFKTIEETKEWITEGVLKHQQGSKEEYLILDDQEFIGMISPSFNKPHQAELGIWIAEKQQGKGYGKQATFKLIEMLVERGITEIIYETDHDNQASISLAKSLNFELLKNTDDGITFILRV